MNARRTEAGDRGVATVWAALAVVVLLGILATMLDVATAVAARHRAEAAADLAALAAAGQAFRTPGTACTRASDVASRTGARLVQCRLQNWEALVEVEVSVPLSLLGTITVRGRARAGPATADPSVRPDAPESPNAATALITPSGRWGPPNGPPRETLASSA